MEVTPSCPLNDIRSTLYPRLLTSVARGDNKQMGINLFPLQIMIFYVIPFLLPQRRTGHPEYRSTANST